MRKELQDKLYNDFPELFYKLIADKDYISCPDGWFDMIYDLSNQINNLKPKELTYEVTQVKIKFGGLRYYMTRTTPEMNELITQFENKSYDICGSCGKEKDLTKPNQHMFNTNMCSICLMIKNIIE